MSKKSDFPWYFAVSDRLVKVLASSDGGMDVLLANPMTGQLERNMAYLTACFEPGQDVQRLSEEEFQARLASLQQASTSASQPDQ